ncbi:MAG: 2-C-methyl-D-erythritol 2,4-cyclodiphosphate synthase [Bacteroidota bacterium]
MKIRVGMGFDVHRLKEGRKCIIGGVEIPHHAGPDGHSDADVLIHAICDALLGAAGLRDIGFHFPDTDAAYKSIDSKILLRRVVALLHDNGFSIGNIDSTLVMEQPRINPHVETMKQVLSEVIGIDVEDIAIKATTNEKMGFIGRSEGVTAYAVALISKN